MMDPDGQIPYWEEMEERNPPEGVVDPEELRPKVFTTTRGRVPAVFVGDARTAARILRPWYKDAEVEFVSVMLLNTKNKLIGLENVTKGTIDTALVHPREVFKAAIRMNAGSVIVAHNHPSGEPRPSKEDDAWYQWLANASHILGIRLLDCLILGRDDFYFYSELREAVYE